MPPEIDELDPDTIDDMIGRELDIQTGGQLKRGKVIKRAKDSDGNLIGNKNPNPILDTSEYLVKFTDGGEQEIAANVILENLMEQCDSEGNQYTIFKGIYGHREVDRGEEEDPKKETKKDERPYDYNAGMMCPDDVTRRKRKRSPDKKDQKTTREWDIQVEWTNGEVSWIPMKDVKTSNPIELAEYAVNHDLQDEPAFSWWVSRTLNRRKHFVSKVKTKYWSTTHKFGIKMPKNVSEALRFDEEMSTPNKKCTLWYDAIKKEMKNIRIAFKEWEGGTIQDLEACPQLLPGYQYVDCRMNFEIKMDGNFTGKAMFVARGDMTDPPSSMTYSSVVSRESIRILFFLAALLDLEVLSANIGNAYLNAPCREKIYTYSGEEFGQEEKRKVMIIERALYGLKSSGASWRDTFVARIRNKLHYENTKADPDVWRRPAVKQDQTTYYEYLCVYVDDILVVSERPKDTMDEIERKIKRTRELLRGTDPKVSNERW